MNNAPLPSGEAAPLDQLRLDDRRKALRALLRKPLLLADEPNDATDFTRVRRHAVELREWFSRQAGWTLDVTAEFARLRKIPADLSDSTRAAVDTRSGEPFTRRRYVLLSLALAVLARSERQTTLGCIANQISHLWLEEPSLGDAGLSFTMESLDGRRDLVQVIRLLLLWRVLRRVDGTEERFLQDSSADVLYTVRHILLARLLVVRRPPSLITATNFEEQLFAIVEEPTGDTDEQRNRRIRVRLIRRLLDDPVIFYQDLPPDERAYVARQRWHLLMQLVEATGFEPEERNEGVGLADPFGDSSDLGMPEEGTDGHATILVSEFLAAHRLQFQDCAVSFSVIADFLAAKAKEHCRHWRREVLAPGSEHDFARSIAQRLAGLGLVRIVADSIVPMPAIHRFRLRENPSEAIA